MRDFYLIAGGCFGGIGSFAFFTGRPILFDLFTFVVGISFFIASEVASLPAQRNQDETR